MSSALAKTLIALTTIVASFLVPVLVRAQSEDLATVKRLKLTGR